MNELQLLFGFGAIPIVLGVVQILKAYVPDPRAWPVLAVAVAVLWNGALALVLATHVGVALLMGVVAGLAAAGTYSSGKTLRAGAP